MLDHMTNPDSQSHLPLESGAPIILYLHCLQMFAALTYLKSVSPVLFLTGDTVVVCVNNLGALSCLEMAVVARAAVISLGNLLECVCVCIH